MYIYIYIGCYNKLPTSRRNECCQIFVSQTSGFWFPTCSLPSLQNGTKIPNDSETLFKGSSLDILGSFSSFEL